MPLLPSQVDTKEALTQGSDVRSPSDFELTTQNFYVNQMRLPNSVIEGAILSEISHAETNYKRFLQQQPPPEKDQPQRKTI